MSRPGPAVVVAVGIAAAIAVLGAIVNLRLLEPHRGTEAPIVLGATVERTTSTAGPTPSTIAAPPPNPPGTTTTTSTAGWRRSYEIGSAGSVTIVVRGTVLEVESVVPSAGWVYEVEERRDDEVEIQFRRAGHEDESTFHASLHGDELRVEIDPAEGESPDD
jgi:hypothetical protein